MNKINKFVIVLDPGHAVSTPGKKSPYCLNKVPPELSFEEWEFNRDIANRLAKSLTDVGFNVFKTTDDIRDLDKDVSLSIRAERANEYVKKSGKKGLFISIHSNAFKSGKTWEDARGWSCYTTMGQNNSDKLADCLYQAAYNLFPKDLKIREEKSIDKDSDYEKNFTVIVKANMPAILTENFFYDNIEDCKYLISDEGRETITRVHFEGIKNYVEKYG